VNGLSMNKPFVFFLIKFPESVITGSRQEQLRQYFVDDNTIANGRAEAAGIAETMYFALLFVAYTRPLLVTIGFLSLLGLILSVLVRVLG
jgi:hypothetical protein